ncbi:MAG: UDP-2,3-diacylglucosamine diphosphatase [Gammaproteobacteria bacterium]|nr:UDP-2,3-diacylglucosamine diphosphatase [Gammaproteobacteria bacterium]
MPPTHRMKVRTLLLSDVHLGTRGCQAELLLDFLRHCECEQIYLVGDIVDGWRLKSHWYWPRSHDAVVAYVLAKAREGVQVRYIPGNHDAFLRDSADTWFGGVEILKEAIHETANGRRYLVLHGDRFDLVATYTPWLARMGDIAYRALLAANIPLNRARRRRGLPFWSLSAWTKLKVKEAVNFISDYETRIAAEARRQGVRGVICGHIHHAAMHDNQGVLYINTGDWVESCTAVVEHFDGHFEIVRWPEIRGRSDAEVVNLGAVRRARIAFRRRLDDSVAAGPARRPGRHRMP